MKKLSLIALLACVLTNIACENDDTLNETRVPDVMAPSVSLSNISVNKYDATFAVKLEETGNPVVREYGVLVSSDPQPTITNSEILVANADETSVTLTRTFSPGTTYYACAYALTANKIVTSEVKQFETEAHQLGAFLGSKTLSGFNLHAGDVTSITVTISPDENDENIAYLSGLSSNAGVQLELGTIKLFFDLDAGTVTIPDGQIIPEAKYGNYRYVAMDEETNPIPGDIVGIVEEGSVYFDTLAAVIVAGGNAGLFHWAYANISIE